MFTILTPLPGTDLYHEKKKEMITSDYEHFDFVHSVLPTRLPIEEFYGNFVELYKKCYSSGREGQSTISKNMVDQVFSVIGIS